jgi:hypothetical protein
VSTSRDTRMSITRVGHEYTPSIRSVSPKYVRKVALWPTARKPGHHWPTSSCRQPKCRVTTAVSVTHDVRTWCWSLHQGCTSKTWCCLLYFENQWMGRGVWWASWAISVADPATMAHVLGCGLLMLVLCSSSLALTTRVDSQLDFKIHFSPQDSAFPLLCV